MQHACIALVETLSVAHGLACADALLKESPVRVHLSRPIHPGKYATLMSGEVEEVRRALDRAVQVAGDSLVDSLWLPRAHESLLPAAFGEPRVAVDDALGILETFTIASTLLAADAAAKNTRAELVRIRLADGLGGKGYVLIAGAVEDVESSIDAGASLVESSGLLQARVVIPRVHPELVEFLSTQDPADDDRVRHELGLDPGR